MDKEKCQDCGEKGQPVCIPFFAHENTVMHMNLCNRRMLIALITVCVTFILTIVIFVHGYTVREKNWLDTLTGLQNDTPAAAEATDAPDDGVHE